MKPILYFNVLTIVVLLVIWIGLVIFLRFKKKKSFIYLIFLTLFYIYVVKVLDYTIFQFQSLILLKQLLPNLQLNGVTTGKSVNLFPLVTLSSQDLKTSILNILLFVPFGFGLPFITNFRMEKVVVLGMLFSVVIELLQFVTGILGGITFRIADINDVIFNTVGVILGYILFIGFVNICRHKFRNRKNPVIRYILER